MSRVKLVTEFSEPKPRERFWDGLAAVANVIFALALLPTVLAGAILPVLTILATLVALGMLQAILLHFKLTWGAVWNAICMAMWVALLIIAL